MTVTDPELEAMIREASGRIGDPNDWTAEERDAAIREGWIRRAPS